MNQNRNIANVENVVKKTINRRGQEKRRQYTASFKAEVVEEHESGMKEIDIVMLYRINRSLVCSKNFSFIFIEVFFFATDFNFAPI